MTVTRFPPSPTGFLHIGNARTALFNWCYARANQGQFVLRIEDTDKQRSTTEAVDAIFEALEWMGIDYDGEAVYQSKNAGRHAEIAHELLAKGQAYWCHCTPEELEAMRETAKQNGGKQGYDGTWRERDQEEAPADSQPVLRIKAPQSGVTQINDQVQGLVTVENDQLDDFILLRADGSPTYMLAVVVDDHDMGVTHVIRGDDHLNNAFRQKVIIDAMGWEPPIYAHCPLLHGEDGAKFSKRHGALGVMDYAAQGYLPEAVFNYLMRLGWAHGDDEIFSKQQAVAWFTLDGVNKAPARFDHQKLNHLNQHYLREADPQRLLDLMELDITAQQKQWLISGMGELVERSTTLKDLAFESGIYIAPIMSDEAKELVEGNQDTLQALLNQFETMDDAFDKDQVQQGCKDVAKQLHDGKLGKVGMPLRAALTGRKASPGIFDVAAILGQEETCKRLQKALNI